MAERRSLASAVTATVPGVEPEMVRAFVTQIQSAVSLITSASCSPLSEKKLFEYPSLPVFFVFQERLSEKSKYSNPLGACRFQIEAAMAPCLMVFTGLISTFFVCSDIDTSMMVINNRPHITVFGFLSSISPTQRQKTMTPKTCRGRQVFGEGFSVNKMRQKC